MDSSTVSSIYKYVHPPDAFELQSKVALRQRSRSIIHPLEIFVFWSTCFSSSWYLSSAGHQCTPSHYWMIQGFYPSGSSLSCNWCPSSVQRSTCWTCSGTITIFDSIYKRDVCISFSSFVVKENKSFDLRIIQKMKSWRSTRATRTSSRKKNPCRVSHRFEENTLYGTSCQM